MNTWIRFLYVFFMLSLRFPYTFVDDGNTWKRFLYVFFTFPLRFGLYTFVMVDGNNWILEYVFFMFSLIRFLYVFFTFFFIPLWWLMVILAFSLWFLYVFFIPDGNTWIRFLYVFFTFSLYELCDGWVILEYVFFMFPLRFLYTFFCDGWW